MAELRICGFYPSIQKIRVTCPGEEIFVVYVQTIIEWSGKTISPKNILHFSDNTLALPGNNTY